MFLLTPSALRARPSINRGTVWRLRRVAKDNNNKYYKPLSGHSVSTVPLFIEGRAECNEAEGVKTLHTKPYTLNTKP